MFESERTKKIVFAFWSLYGQVSAGEQNIKEEFDRMLEKIEDEDITYMKMFDSMIEEIDKKLDGAIERTVSK